MSSGRRRVVVVGAGSGIGAALAAHFDGLGDHVLAVDLRPPQNPVAQFIECDLRDATAIDRLLDEMGHGWDLLAYIAGVPGTAPAVDVLKVNYLAWRLMAEGMLPLMSEGGAIVAVASTAGTSWRQRSEDLSDLLAAIDADAVERWLADRDDAYPVYNTSKEAAILYAQRLAGSAWAKYRVRVNTVSPGPVETPILPDFEKTMGKEVLDAVRAATGRHATVDDIVPVIAFLGSTDAGWINGQDVQVDAGFMTSMTAGPPIDL